MPSKDCNLKMVKRRSWKDFSLVKIWTAVSQGKNSTLANSASLSWPKINFKISKTKRVLNWQKYFSKVSNWKSKNLSFLKVDHRAERRFKKWLKIMLWTKTFLRILHSNKNIHFELLTKEQLILHTQKLTYLNQWMGLFFIYLPWLHVHHNLISVLKRSNAHYKSIFRCSHST
jgi:hypothetical protein